MAAPSQPRDNPSSLEPPSGTVHKEFVGEIKAAIDARFGSASRDKTLTPMTDAPLFKLNLQQSSTYNSISQHVDLVLPQRKHADHLVSLYWQHIYPLEPFVDRRKFERTYQGLFAGDSPDPPNERIFLSTLNALFALATQLQENMPSERRDSESNTYFGRAWALLRLEAGVLWESASPELVQCLLLVGRYLQCTNRVHQTWMAIGLAIRTAQSLGLHTAVQDGSDNVRRRLWQCCVYMDRYFTLKLAIFGDALLITNVY